MDKHKLYIETLSIFFLSTMIGLYIIDVSDLQIYITIFIIGYFIITALYRPRKKWIDVFGIVLIIIFLYIAATNVLSQIT